jgi:hypothetical protein
MGKIPATLEFNYSPITGWVLLILKIKTAPKPQIFWALCQSILDFGFLDLRHCTCTNILPGLRDIVLELDAIGLTVSSVIYFGI